MYFENVVEIERPVEEVFAYLSVHKNHQEFVPQNKRSRQVSDGPMGVGTIVENEASFMGMKMVETFEIIEFEPNKLISKRSHEGSTVETTDRFELESLPNGNTKVTIIVTGSPKGFFQKTFFKLLSGSLKKSMRTIAGELKRVLESKPRAQPEAPVSGAA